MRSPAERAYVTKFENHLKTSLRDIQHDGEFEDVLGVFRNGKRTWLEGQNSSQPADRHSLQSVVSDFETTVMNAATKSPYYEKVRDVMTSAQLKMFGSDESVKGPWMNIKDGQFVPADMDAVSEQRNNLLVRDLGDNNYEVLTTYASNDGFYELMDTCQVNHCPSYNSTESIQKLDDADLRLFRETYGEDIRDLTPASQLGFMTDMSFGHYLSQTSDLNKDFHSTSHHESFYPHMLKDYIEQLDSAEPVEPDVFLKNSDWQEDYTIADRRFRESTFPKKEGNTTFRELPVIDTSKSDDDFSFNL